MNHIIFLNGIWPNKEGATPNNFTRSISCYQLKHWLSYFSIDSQVIDFCQLLSKEEIYSLLEQFVSDRTISIAVSTTFWPSDGSIPPNLLDLFELVRDRWPHLKIIAGGARKCPAPNLFDKIFTGESENKLVEWCQFTLGRHSLLNKKFNITTLSHRFDDKDAILDGEALPIELGRGCIFKCKFCAHHNLGKPKFTYQRHFDLIVDEMKYNYEKFGTTKYMLLDDTVNEDLDKIKNLANLKNLLGFNIEWTGYLRADLVWAKSGSAELLIESGMRSCFFGVETFHPAAGKSIDKGWGAKHGKEYLPKLYKDIWGEKINIHVNLIAGLPYETKESLEDSLQWCKDNPMGSHRFVPLTLYVEKDDDYAVSEFTKNYTDYGYKNVKDGYWELDTMTQIDSTEFCNRANKVLSRQNRVSSWDVFNITNLGFNTDDVLGWGYGKYWLTYLRKSKEFKNRYLDKLKSINT